jgi:hypothetical protein
MVSNGCLLYCSMSRAYQFQIFAIILSCRSEDKRVKHCACNSLFRTFQSCEVLPYWKTLLVNMNIVDFLIGATDNASEFEEVVSNVMDWDNIVSYTKCLTCVPFKLLRGVCHNAFHSGDSTQLQVIALEKLFNKFWPRTSNQELKKAAVGTEFLDSLAHLVACKNGDVVTAVSKVLSAMVVSSRHGAHLNETKALIQRGFIQLLVPLLQ